VDAPRDFLSGGAPRVYKYGMARPRAIPPHFPLALVLAFAFVSCAGPNKLAQQSEEAFRKGDTEKAYEKAARSLDKAPGNDRGLREEFYPRRRMFARHRARTPRTSKASSTCMKHGTPRGSRYALAATLCSCAPMKVA